MILFNLIEAKTGALVAQSTSYECSHREALWRESDTSLFVFQRIEREGWFGMNARAVRFGAPWPLKKTEEFECRYLAGEPMRALEMYFDTSWQLLSKKRRAMGLPRRVPPTARPKRLSNRPRKSNYKIWPVQVDLMNYLLAEGMGIDEITQHFKSSKASVVRRLSTTAKAYGNATNFRAARRRDKAERAAARKEVRTREAEIYTKLGVPNELASYIGRGGKTECRLPKSIAAALAKKLARKSEGRRAVGNFTGILRNTER